MFSNVGMHWLITSQDPAEPLFKTLPVLVLLGCHSQRPFSGLAQHCGRHLSSGHSSKQCRCHLLAGLWGCRCLAWLVGWRQAAATHLPQPGQQRQPAHPLPMGGSHLLVCLPWPLRCHPQLSSCHVLRSSRQQQQQRRRSPAQVGSRQLRTPSRQPPPPHGQPCQVSWPGSQQTASRCHLFPLPSKWPASRQLHTSQPRRSTAQLLRLLSSQLPLVRRRAQQRRRAGAVQQRMQQAPKQWRHVQTK